MFGLLPSIGPWEIVAILAIVLIIFGPGRLPEAVKSLGRAVKDFRRASTEPGPGEAGGETIPDK